MPRLTLVRHAPTPWNEDRRYQGWSDPGLSPAGERRAACLRDRLADSHFDAVVASDLRRCRETLEAALPSAEVRYDPRLREMNYGAWEGQTHEACLKRFAERYRAWKEEPGANPPPGGETLADFEERVKEALADLPEGDRILLVAHAGTIRSVLAAVLGIPFIRAMRFRISGCGLTEVDWQWEGPSTIVAVNDTLHLADLLDRRTVAPHLR
jgi:alpha-ribazole phosphatase